MKENHKFALWSAGAVLLVVVWIATSFWIFRQNQNAADEYSRTFVILYKADQLLSELKDAETGQRGYLLTGDETFLQPYLAVNQNIRGHLAELRQLVLLGEAHVLTDELPSLVDAKLEELDRVIGLRRTQGIAAAVAAVAEGRGKLSMDSIRRVMGDLTQMEAKALEQRGARFDEAMHQMFAVIVTASLVTLLFAVSFVYSLSRGTQQRLKNQAHLETQRFLEAQQETNKLLQQANVTLEVSEQKLAVTLKSIGDGVIATDADGRVTLLNPVAEQLTGWTQAEAAGRPMGEILNIVGPEIPPASRLSESGTPGSAVLQSPTNYATLVSRDGGERAIADSCAPIRDRDGHEVGAVQVFRDVTDRQRADQELRRALADLKHANADLAQGGRLKDEFLANMSHELRTPLNAILGLSEALLEQASGPLTPRQVKSVAVISSSGAHLLTLINDILDLSKVEAGKLELSPEVLNVQEFCESCLLFVRTQAMQKNIGLSFEHGAPAADFSADPKRLKQILVNLLTNAVKFTPEGGKIGLIVTAPEGEEVVRFTVWDTGIGIAPEDERKLFRAFTQIDSGLTRAQEGTGLGLALVAKLVELHGGSLALESAPGKGSRFIVTLPQIAAGVTTRDPGLKTEPDRRGYRRALVIEDDATSGAILVNYLTELGLSSVLHVRGEESVETALREQPDVILLDVLLPGDSGWVVLVRLKENPLTRDIPVVVVSVVDEPGRARALGAAGHFLKPVTRAQLAGFLQRDAVTLHPSAVHSGGSSASVGPTILLAEDNEANVQTIGGYLEDKGYAMQVANNGAVAVRLARERRPALILMDIQMPVMDGLTAIREIRGDPSLKGIPIIALTALAMPGDRERCLTAGATDYMSKPVKLKTLEELVKRLVAAELKGISTQASA